MTKLAGDGSTEDAVPRRLFCECFFLPLLIWGVALWLMLFLRGFPLELKLGLGASICMGDSTDSFLFFFDFFFWLEFASSVEI